ncbi:hypothetical protein C5142_12970 [Rhodococcus sp. BGS-1C]|uniref:hypothetical protein n=1 Tax=unclassified Rhodococcus (in: high G+C Gram-positive bacteria) TaxID=192944 RepID=UPI0019D0426A|nr:hypothetical protein [Rhodococcus sp. KRD197]
MNSASPSKPSADEARQLVGDIETWSDQGRRMSSPVWFPLLCVAVAVLAAIPAGIVLGESWSGLYWAVMAPASAVASGWFFATRRVQPPVKLGVVVLVTGVVMLLATMTLLWFVGGPWVAVGPWLVLGIGLGIFALAWRSITIALVAAASAVSATAVALADFDSGYALVALVVGLVAAIAVFVELIRTDTAHV